MKNSILRRSLAGVMGVVLASSALVGAAASFAPAGATGTWGTGYVEICKTLTAAPAGVNISPNANFTYSITGVSGLTTVAAGTCSPRIAVSVASTGSPITITETQAPWYKVNSISQLPGQNYIVGTPNLTTGSVVVHVTNSANVDTVSYVNSVVTGYVEVCKSAVAGSGLTGSYGFTVTGADNFSTSTVATVNGCSAPILVPAGSVNVTETGTNLYVSSITALTNGVGANQLTASNLVAGTATANVAASANTTVQTDVTYTNNVVSFKICKAPFVGTEPGGASTAFGFTVASDSLSPAGPTAVTSPISLLAGQCSTPVSLRAGTKVTVTESIVPGTKVASITTDGTSESVVPGSLSTLNRTVQVIVGTPTSLSSTLSAPTNEAIVTFTNQAADLGTLKICKVAGTNPGPPIGSVFSFSVTGAPGTTSVTVGQCAFVLNASGTPMQFPFNSTVTVTEAGSAGNAAQAITAIPMNVEENVGGTLTATSELVAGAASLGAVGAASSIPITIGEDYPTEVTFTNVDPPVPGTNPVTVTIPGGTGTVTAGGIATATSVATSPSTASAVASFSAATAASSATLHALSAKQTKALLKADKAMLKGIEAKIVIEQRRVVHTRGKNHRAAVKQLSSLRAREHVLKMEISLLK